MAKTPKLPKYWQLTGCWGPWQLFGVDEPQAWDLGVRSRRGRPLKKGQWPTPPPVFTYKKVPKRFDALPACVVDMFIVSDRLRQFFEREAPGSAEYFPVTLQGPESERIPQRYWAVNWLRVIDILDESSWNSDENGRYVEVPAIDPSRAKPEDVLGVLGHYEVVRLIRNDLKLKMKKEGITGPDFFSIGHVDRTVANSAKQPKRSKLRGVSGRQSKGPRAAKRKNTIGKAKS